MVMCDNTQKCKETKEENLIEVNLLRFVRVLRHSGLRVSSAETIEAVNSLNYIDIADRREVKAALQATLVKDQDQLQAFNQAFDTFFVPETERENINKKYLDSLDEKNQQLEKAQEELQFQEESLQLTEDESLAYNQMSPEEQERLKEFLEQTSQGKKVGKKFKPIVESLVKGHLDRWQRMQDFHKMDLDGLGDETLDALLAELERKYPRENSLMFQDMGKISDDDLPKMRQVIQRLSRRLATKISRRYEQSKRASQVDIRRTIRHNLRYGGIPINLKFRERRIRKPDIMLLCDVSGSMAKYSTFTMLFMAGLVSAIRNLRVFLFSETLEQVKLSRNAVKDVEGFISTMQEDSRVWGEGTNLNSALKELMSRYAVEYGGNTIIIIISDTKTLQAGKAAEKLKRIQRQVKKIIWLNPLPKEQWNKQKTVSIFREQSQMHLCHTLAQLDEVLSNKLFK